MNFESRLEKVQRFLGENNLDAVVISSSANIIYLTGFTNFSSKEREAYLVILKDKSFILTDARYSETIKTKVSHFKLLVNEPGKSRFDIIHDLTRKLKLKTIGFEENDLTFFEYKKLSVAKLTLKEVNIDNLREVKEIEEIEFIKKACEIGDRAFKFLLKKITIGISEKEIALELDLFVKKQQAGFSFQPIIAFGENASIPHHQTGDKRLSKKDGFVLLDFGIKYNSYCSDMTRTVFVNNPTQKQKQIYESVLNAQKVAIDYIKKCLIQDEKISASLIDQKAREYILSKGFLQIPHSVGHGIGLLVHESPHLSPKSTGFLKQGMVFSIEPGIYINGFGGVRIEDLFLISGNLLTHLTDAPKQLIKIDTT